MQVSCGATPTRRRSTSGTLLALDAQVERRTPGRRSARPATAREQGDQRPDQQDLSHAELISLPITLVILVLAFGALVAACVPLILGITAVAGAIGALGLVSHMAPNSESTSAIVVLIGLAVGVDYSLFYVRREREERRRGHGRRAGTGRATTDSALEAAASSVGRAILVAGLTVMAALAGLLLTGAGDFVSIGLGTILVVAIAVVGSLTVLPAVLALLGDRVDRGRIPGYRRRGAPEARRLGPGVHRLVGRAGPRRDPSSARGPAELGSACSARSPSRWSACTPVTRKHPTCRRTCRWCRPPKRSSRPSPARRRTPSSSSPGTTSHPTARTGLSRARASRVGGHRWPRGRHRGRLSRRQPRARRRADARSRAHRVEGRGRPPAR